MAVQQAQQVVVAVAVVEVAVAVECHLSWSLMVGDVVIFLIH